MYIAVDNFRELTFDVETTSQDSHPIVIYAIEGAQDERPREKRIYLTIGDAERLAAALTATVAGLKGH